MKPEDKFLLSRDRGKTWSEQIVLRPTGSHLRGVYEFTPNNGKPCNIVSPLEMTNRAEINFVLGKTVTAIVLGGKRVLIKRHS